jgi:hypothetical protein
MSTTLEQSLRPVEIAEGMPEIQGHEVPGPTIYTIG